MSKWQSHLALLRCAALDLLWPRGCPACQRPLAVQEQDWCGPCAAQILEASRLPYCPTCGQTASVYIVKDGRCPACQERSLGCERVIRAARYAGAIRQAILRYKYERDQSLDVIFARMIHAAIHGAGLAGEIECFVPVPLHWKRLLWRRFNQAGLIARLLAKWERSVCLSALRRVEDRPPQIRVPRSRRAENIRGVFAVTRAARHLTGRTVCIVDDVTTTGATVREVAKTLKAVGPSKIYAALLAVAEADDASDLELRTF